LALDVVVRQASSVDRWPDPRLDRGAVVGRADRRRTWPDLVLGRRSGRPALPRFGCQGRRGWLELDRLRLGRGRWRQHRS